MSWIHTAVSVLILSSGLVAAPVDAAESYDNCTGFIDTVPATISTQGTWCLRQDLATGIGTGNAITVTANNVTIDCNDFKLGGLAAGTDTNAQGIRSTAISTTVRNCRVRGFRIGVALTSDYGLVENNRLDLNTRIGILTQGDGAIIRRNTVLDTGGLPSGDARGIEADGPANILDNTIIGVSASVAGNTSAIGIILFAGSLSASTIEGNRVRRLTPGGTGHRYGIYVPNSHVLVRGNGIMMTGAVAGDVGVQCSSPNIVTVDNVVVGWAAGAFSPGCVSGGGNAAP